MKTKLLILSALLVATALLSACAERTPGQDVRLQGYDGVYKAYPVE